MKIERRTPGWRRASTALIALGLLDFVGAVGMGTVTSSGVLAPWIGPNSTPVLGDLPLSLIPTFLVPLWIILHLIAWIRVRSHV